MKKLGAKKVGRGRLRRVAVVERVGQGHRELRAPRRRASRPCTSTPRSTSAAPTSGRSCSGIKNSGADGLYLPLDADTNFAIVQGLQQNGVKMKANVLATGYGQDLLDQPIAKTHHAQRRDVLDLQAGRARRTRRSRSSRPTSRSTPASPACPTTARTPATSRATWPSSDCKNAGQEPDPPGLRRRHPQDQRRHLQRRRAHVQADRPQPRELRQDRRTSCKYFVDRQERQVQGDQRRQADHGKLVGDPKLIAANRAGTASVTTTAPAS